MRNYDDSVEKYHNPNWPYIPNHPNWILIIGDSGSSKTNVLFNVIKHQQPDTRYQILTKFIYTSNIHSNQSINCL